ncbi:MAG: UDP-N-acetylglucosamine 2-epimerase (non-hydrolyzing) [Chloroflexota bacterium]|nr:UDP-N-acetylglucosamine 2-epimerase (non-hydrolyzing) [Chloroflexota bacterium]
MSTRKKILSILGTRPEAIKLAPVIVELNRRPEIFDSRVCITAQHRDMLDQALLPFDIEVHHDLDIMMPGQSLAEVTSRAVAGLDRVILEEQPDVILVQGDTTTVFCGALAGYYNQVTVGHVEAGLRTGDKYSPFPEEGNRRLTGHLADLHFAPTEQARNALLREGISPDAIFVTGNTVIDSLLWMRDRVRGETPALPPGLAQQLADRQVVLVTGHRRESFGPGFENICWAIREVADRFDDVLFVYPVHLNPRVREPVKRILGSHDRIALIEPQPYESFVWLMDRSEIVLTDSGGVQEEAPSLGKPVLVMRETTERPEGIEAGNARLVGVEWDRIVAALAELLQHPKQRAAMGQVRNPYGDGQASVRIADILAQQ